MIVSVINNKGGVGKTTITQNLAHALANRGKRVLVIDQDPQSNTSSVLTPLSGANTLFNLYRQEAPASACIYPTPYENVDILPNCSKTATLEIELHADVRKSYFLLRDHVREIALSEYDLCLIDCPPNLGLFCIMALICSDSAIIPIEAGSRYSVEGFINAFEAIEAAASAVKHNLRFLRAVINKYNSRAIIHKTFVDYLRRTFDAKLFSTAIPINTEIQRAETDCKTVIRFNPHSSSSRRFKFLAEELLEVIHAKEAM